MKTMKAFRLAALAAFVSLAGAGTLAQDTTEARQAAADRYLQAVPMAKMLDDSFAEISKTIPPDQRAQFIADIKSVVRVDFLQALTRESMVKTFTADELNALADFYGSVHGASAMQKFGAYVGRVMPAIQAEMMRGIQELQQRKQQQPRPS